MKHLLFEKIDDSKAKSLKAVKNTKLRRLPRKFRVDEEQDAWVYYFCSIA